MTNVGKGRKLSDVLEKAMDISPKSPMTIIRIINLIDPNVDC
jgi:hypothetical protein